MNFKMLVLKENNSLTVILSGFAWTHDLHHFLLSPDVVLPPLWWKNSVGNSCKFLNHPEKVKLEWILFIRQTTNLSTDWVWLAASRGTTRGFWANSSTSLSAKFVILQLYKTQNSIEFIPAFGINSPYNKTDIVGWTDKENLFPCFL